MRSCARAQHLATLTTHVQTLRPFPQPPRSPPGQYLLVGDALVQRHAEHQAVVRFCNDEEK